MLDLSVMRKPGDEEPAGEVENIDEEVGIVVSEEDVVDVLPKQKSDKQLKRKQDVADVELGEDGAPGPAEWEATAREGLGAGGKEERTVDVMRQDNGPEAVLYDQIFRDLSGNT